MDSGDARTHHDEPAACRGLFRPASENRLLTIFDSLAIGIPRRRIAGSRFDEREGQSRGGLADEQSFVLHKGRYAAHSINPYARRSMRIHRVLWKTMTTLLAPSRRTLAGLPVPAVLEASGDDAIRRFTEFFTATIRNPNTRAAYARAVSGFFSWCDSRGINRLEQIEPIVVAAWIEELQRSRSAPTVKQHLAAVRMLFDWLVTGHIVRVNPASSVRGPKHVIRKGKTPVLTAEECRHLLDTINTSTISGLRDRAIIGVMVFSFARVSATIGMNVGDFYQSSTRWLIRLHEKGGKYHEVPGHHRCAEYVDAYLDASGIRDDRKSPLFRALDRRRRLTDRRITRGDVLRMVKRRAAAAGLPTEISCHSFRATGITAYLEAGGTLENAQAIAAHESPRTTRLYDRTSDAISLDEIERIQI